MGGKLKMKNKKIKIIKIKIGEAKRKDINSIVEMGKSLADFHAGIDNYYKSGEEQAESHRKWLLKNFGKRNFKVLIAKDRNKLLAYGIAGIRKPRSFVRPKKIGNIISLFVKEEYRKKGIGRQIFNKFLDWFKSQNIKHIEISADRRNKIAIKAYKKYGFFEFQKKMRLDL